MVTCPICTSSFHVLTLTHLKNHQLNAARFKEQFPRHDRGYGGRHHPWFGKRLPTSIRQKISRAMRGNTNALRARQQHARRHSCRTTFDEQEWRRRISQAMQGKVPWNILSNEKLLVKLRQLSRLLKKIPTQREMTNAAGFPDRKVYARAFGSWKHALTLAGFAPNRRYGIIGLAEDGHSCRSYPELVIDDWLTRHGIRHEKDATYPDSRWTADWKVAGIFVEYFGIEHNQRYTATVERKRLLCQQLGLRLVELYPDDIKHLECKLSSVIEYSSRGGAAW